MFKSKLNSVYTKTNEMLLKIVLVIYLMKNIDVEAKKPPAIGIVGNPLAFFHPCKDNEDIVAEFEPGKPPDEENQYGVSVGMVYLAAGTRIYLTLDSAAKITLTSADKARIFDYKNTSRDFFIHYFAKAEKDEFSFEVKGPETGTVPYITSIKINQVEHCEEPEIGFLDKYVFGFKPETEFSFTSEDPEDTCGKRKVMHTELILNGLETKPGDWPWHAALYRNEKTYVKYICGGTLISKTTILTAAHCVTMRGSKILSELLHIVLGKHNLFLGDSNAQEIDVHEIKIHNDFTTRHLNNDIALLKLKNEAKLTDYVQPACLWHFNDQKKLPPGQEYGTVVGWGLNEEDIFVTELKKAVIPKLSANTCIKSNPAFYSNVLLNNRKFCAGYTNGTSPCNGDSGGGFHMFVPNIAGDVSTTDGSWHVRGIVSLAISRQDKPICDPKEYVIFTDIAPFRDWIISNI